MEDGQDFYQSVSPFITLIELNKHIKIAPRYPILQLRATPDKIFTDRPQNKKYNINPHNSDSGACFSLRDVLAEKLDESRHRNIKLNTHHNIHPNQHNRAHKNSIPRPSLIFHNENKLSNKHQKIYTDVHDVVRQFVALIIVTPLLGVFEF